MVALLYSCTIVLVAIPLAPTTALLAVLLHIANFKFDKFILMHLQKKPTNPWAAKGAGSFFIKFYFCTVLIFLSFTHFFLLNTQMTTLQREQHVALTFSSLRRKIKQLENRLRLQKIGGGRSNDVGGN
ncbi:hypothetical protein PHMEG_00030736 [Phytophthora megakarya]|uniref:Transmembrane protein n=1 Tax=Phytophthora megakarya TaxID=4795 RepID=A0A225UZM9_9STRA|nr:hypothetical protein PHMEG_00030736 [Phytophthora megakarya]